NDFAGVDADKLRLWKVEIGGDHLDDPLKNLTLNDNNELSAINEIGDYWTEKLPKKHIHVLVEPPASTATSAREQELLERISLLEKSLSKSVHGMYFCQEISGTVQSRKSLGYESLKLTGLWKAFTNPVVALQHSTLFLKEHIRGVHKTPALENDGAENNLKSTVFIETPSKSFSDWSFPKMCQLYGLGESDDPSLSVFPPFTCEYKEMEEDSSKAIFNNLVTKLKARLKAILISGNEASKSQYVCSYLVAGVNLYEGKFELRPEKNITGPNGHRPVNFAIDLLQTAKTVGVTEASEMEEESVFVGKIFGIITDAEKWYFMECSLDNQDRLRFKLSEPMVVVYKDENMENMVKKVLGHIAWLLEEVQKPDSASQSEERSIKSLD
ncbi:hypothetical protein RhiirA5_434532, partial [Rhizophagus irregularis]